MYYDCEYHRLRERKAELMKSHVRHAGKKLARRVECTEAGGNLMQVGEQFEKAEKAAKVLNVGNQRINDAANTQTKGVRSNVDGKVYRFKYV